MSELISNGPHDKLIVRRVMISQFLFMAGHSLTVGGFFNYFVNGFRPSALLMAAAMIVPETSQSLSVLGRIVIRRFPDRKRNWILFLIGGRLAAMLLPLALLWPETTTLAYEPLIFILACTAVWYLLQGISYVNYISWLSDLVPQYRWGKLFSRRQLAGLMVSLAMPFLVAWLRQHLLKGLPPEAERWSYSVLFIGGGLLALTSIIPLLSLSDSFGIEKREANFKAAPRTLSLSRSFLLLLGGRWWLAFFQGLTQAVLFRYAVNTLHVSLEVYTTLTSIMVLTQMPMAWWGGKLSDRYLEKWTVFGSMVFLSCAMPCWLLASEQYWFPIVFAYVIWGGFGLLNVCGQNLCLKLSPQHDNSSHFALYDQVAGLVAGIAGLTGGFFLDAMVKTPLEWNGLPLPPVAVLLTISWIGRLTAALWILLVKQPVPVPAIEE